MATQYWRQGKFSDRNNKIDFKDYFQTTTISDETIKFIVKKLTEKYFYYLNALKNNYNEGKINNLYNTMYMYIFGITGNVDNNFLTTSCYPNKEIFENTISNYFLQKYNETRIDLLMDTIETWLDLELISVSEVNNIFGYFLIKYKCLENKQIVPFYSDEEISLINEVLKSTDEVEKEYIEKATEHLFSKNTKSYNEAVNEICKAIENLLQKILNEPKGTLGKLFSKIEKIKPEIKIHSAYKEAMNKLYGWASDGGSRHASQLFPNGASREEAELFYFWGISFLRYIKNISGTKN